MISIIASHRVAFYLTDEDYFRVVGFQQDAETGAECVVDILEFQTPISVFKWIDHIERLLGEVNEDTIFPDVDLGRARTTKGKIKKVLESVIYNR